MLETKELARYTVPAHLPSKKTLRVTYWVVLLAAVLPAIVVVIFGLTAIGKIVGITSLVCFAVWAILILVHYLFYVQVRQGKVIKYGSTNSLTLRKSLKIRGFTRGGILAEQWKRVPRYRYKQYLNQASDEEFIDLR